MDLRLVFTQFFLLAVLIRGDELVHLKALGKYVASLLDKLEKELISAKRKEGKENDLDPGELRSELLSFFTNYTLDVGSLYRPDSRFSTGNQKTEEIGFESNFQLFLYQTAVFKYNISANKVLRILDKKPSPSCRILQPKCDEKNPYRSFDGSCNNLHDPTWGAVETPFNRLLPADYEDNLQEPRGGLSSSKLPSPRQITNSLHNDIRLEDTRMSHLLPVFVQFLEFDMASTPTADKLCCGGEKDALDCFPILVPPNDPFYSKVSQRPNCLRYSRATPYCFPGESGIREQFNTQSAYIDLSVLYGQNLERQADVRSMTKGRLRTSASGPFQLPTKADVESETGREILYHGRFFGGDSRLNSRSALIAIQTLFLREHNRIAGELEKRRPNWSDEQIFPAARRISIAQFQNIVYDQLLGVILGPEYMNKHSLTITKDYSTYEWTVNGAISNEFATAAFKFSRSLESNVIKKYRGSDCMGSYLLKDNWLEFKELEEDNWDGLNTIIGGLIHQPSAANNRHFSEALTNYLFRKLPDEYGDDVVARIVQNGRDNGLPAYNEYRKFCNLQPLTNWTTKPSEFSKSTWDSLEMIYQFPHDIDLFTGGISELPLPGAAVGPVFACIQATQFQKIKNGDRFFFTHKGQLGSFRPEQLANIRNRTLGDIICENSEVPFVTKNVFLVPSLENCKVQCDDPTRNKLNLDLFVD